MSEHFDPFTTRRLSLDSETIHLNYEFTDDSLRIPVNLQLIRDEMTRRITAFLSARVLSKREMVTEETVSVTVEVHVPINWFEHLKQSLGLKPKTKTISETSTRRVPTTTTLRVCPHMSLPGSDTRHVRFLEHNVWLESDRRKARLASRIREAVVQLESHRDSMLSPLMLNDVIRDLRAALYQNGEIES